MVKTKSGALITLQQTTLLHILSGALLQWTLPNVDVVHVGEHPYQWYEESEERIVPRFRLCDGRMKF